MPLRAYVVALFALLALLDTLAQPAAARPAKQRAHAAATTKHRSAACAKAATRKARRACRQRVARRAKAARAKAARAKAARTKAARAKAARARAAAAARAARATRVKKPAATTPPAGTVAADGTGLRFGIVADTQGYGGGMGSRQDLVASTGAKWLREEFEWSVIQPQPGTWNWTRYDALMTAAARRGLNVLPLVDSTPPWAGASWNAIPADPSGFAAVVAAISARYGPGGSFWAAHPELTPRPTAWIELWNEPYFDFFSRGGANPGAYARLVRASVIAGRAANPNVRFLMEVDSVGNSWSDNRSFLSGMYDAVPDLNRYYDAAAVHPYSDGRSPALLNDQYGFQHLAAVRLAMVARGAASKPMWITEIGWSTCGAGAAKQCVTEVQQAAYMAIVLTMARTVYKPFVRAVFAYHYGDFAPGNPNEREQWFGLTRTDGSHKPAFDVFHTAAAQSS